VRFAISVTTRNRISSFVEGSNKYINLRGALNNKAEWLHQQNSAWHYNPALGPILVHMNKGTGRRVHSQLSGIMEEEGRTDKWETLIIRTLYLYHQHRSDADMFNSIPIPLCSLGPSWWHTLKQSWKTMVTKHILVSDHFK
jgi:hypothetical protein